MRSHALLLALIAWPAVAAADWTVCNATADPVWIAIAWSHDGGYESGLWWQLSGCGACRTVLSGGPDAAGVFYYAKWAATNAGASPGSNSRFCARDAKFSFVVENRDGRRCARESIRRLHAYVEAGADVLFAPGVQDPAEIEALVKAVHPKPFNLLVSRDIGLDVAGIAALGVRRISVGGALALAGWAAFIRAARTLKANGSFSGLANVAPYAEINGFLAADLREREAR